MKGSALKRNIAMLIVMLGLGILLSLLMKSVNQGSITTKNVQELQQAVIDYQRKNEDLNNRNSQLYELVRALEVSLAAGGDEQLNRLIEEKERYAIFAGLRDVQNSGVVITLKETEQYRMRDSVLRQFVNELSALGAQAISINGERKVASTEIRANVDEIVINGVPFDRTASFEIRAILPWSRMESYVVPYLETVKDSIANDLPDETYEISISPEQSVSIPALSEDRIAYNLDLLTPVE
jgi:uncharacterized protein YlxW (UPF0749 family)